MKKLLACILALALISTTLVACSGDSGSGGGDATSGAAPATSGAAPSTGGDSTESAYDQLMAMEDVLPLSGVSASHFDSRADVEKALPVEPKDDVTIGWAAASMGSTFFVGMMDSAKEAAKGHGYELLEQNANFDLATQQQQIDAFISQGVDALVLNAVDLHSSTADISRCVEAGIPVIVTGPTAAKDEYQSVTTLLSGSNESGFQVGLYCAEKLYVSGEVLNVGMTISKMSDADSNSRPCGWIAGYLYKKAEMEGKPYDTKYDAILEAYNYWLELKNSGSLDVSDVGLNFMGVGVGDGTDAAAGQTASSDLLTAHPDLNLLIVEMDSQLPGVIQEIKQHSLTPGEDIKVVTCADGTREALDYIKDGEVMATATNIPYYNGKGAVDLIHEIFSTGGEKYNDMPANSFTPTMCVNEDNVDEYYDADSDFALFDDWVPMTTDEYNAAHAGDVAGGTEADDSAA